jgi:hypothetical protein
MKDSSRGFSNQQAFLALLICFPIGLIALGLGVIMLQRPGSQTAQPRESPTERPSTDSGTTIQPLPSYQAPAPQQSGINELEARAIVERWLTVKSQIFAPPFDTNLADQVVASGPLWTDITKSGGSIDWLRNNNSYYSYSTIKVNRVVSFVTSPSLPSIVVSITEDSILHSPSGSKPSSSTGNWIYTLKEEGGAWKVWDYREQ